MDYAKIVAFVSLIFLSAAAASAQNNRISMFEFGQEADAARWRIVNDGVMGGRSTSQARVVNGQLRFAGNLSLQNNGGFASVRSKPAAMGLDANKTIVVRIKGDGRRYTFNLYTPDRRVAFSYQTEFDTRAGEWIEVRLPVRNFVAHSFGRPVAGNALDPSQVQSVGILLGDKIEGRFEMTVDWIRIE